METKKKVLRAIPLAVPFAKELYEAKFIDYKTFCKIRDEQIKREYQELKKTKKQYEAVNELMKRYNVSEGSVFSAVYRK